MSFTILPLTQMSIKSGIIIIFIAILRKVFLFRFPKCVFLSLWIIAITRLLVPLSVSATFIPCLSLYHTLESNQIPLEQPYLFKPLVGAGSGCEHHLHRLRFLYP